jgi:nucleoside-diphosphate-sugar epimerase
MASDLRSYYSSEHNIVVTGSTGYVGRNLLAAYGRSGFVPVGIESVFNATIVHLAADVTSSRDALLTNIDIDTYVLDIANSNNNALIYASSNNVYPYALDCRVNETLRCHDYYSTSKVTGELLIRDLAKTPYLIIRIGDVFGLGQKHGNLFKAIEQSLMHGKQLALIGKGNKLRSYIHIKELVRMIMHLASKMRGRSCENRILNLGYHDALWVYEILSTVSDLTSLEIVQIDQPERTAECDIRTMSVSVLDGYVPLWNSFHSALSNYVSEINTCARGGIQK